MPCRVRAIRGFRENECHTVFWQGTYAYAGYAGGKRLYVESK